ncbi:hypothetical protein J3458_020656 [Metarhizium acridum]|uniref:uncharacterized protein n=1 Tax=Metarhizium acridum TaxID=92637 RepID=UPI001C6AFD09|nr:hypothetical protein J3458_020656 [Metarhizium acridum]
MVLEDELFDKLSFESFDRWVAPKIDGSRLLDELFYNARLDFFILFSSLGSVVGNSGQSSYVAANQYMVALAAQRKKRGVPGSAIALGSLQGIGYISRSDLDEDHFTKLGYRNISEQDYLQLFAEGIVAGRPGNPDSHEIISGLSPIYEDAIKSQLLKDPAHAGPGRGNQRQDAAHVDIPVVKILSASLTVAALVTDAVAKLPPSLLRNPAVQSSPPVFTQFMPRPQNENDDGTLHVASHSVTSSQTGLSTPDTQPSLPK